MSEELKSLSVYSLKDARAGAPTSSKGPGNANDSFASILDASISPKKPPREPAPSTEQSFRRTVSFTNSVSVMGGDDEQLEKPSSSPVNIRRTYSSERFSAGAASRRASGSSARSLSIDVGPSPSDFEIACGRAGVNISSTSPGGFKVGSPDSSPCNSDIEFQHPPHVEPDDPTDAPRYQALDPRDEDVMRDAATKDLALIFGLSVSICLFVAEKGP